jgi:hypothetical protein
VLQLGEKAKRVLQVALVTKRIQIHIAAYRYNTVHYYFADNDGSLDALGTNVEVLEPSEFSRATRGLWGRTGDVLSMKAMKSWT